MGAAKAMLVEKMVTALTTACITNVATNDTSRAGVVVPNKYEGESGKDKIVIVVMESHPEDDVHWMNEMKDHKTDIGFEIPYNFFGGMESITHRGTIKVIVNPNRKAEGQNVVDMRQTVLSRVRQTVRTDTTLKGFTDDYGESVHVFKIARVMEFKKVGNSYVAFVDWIAWATARS